MSVMYALAARGGRARGRGAQASQVFVIAADGQTVGLLPVLVSPSAVALTRERAEELARAAVPRRRAVRVRVEAAGDLPLLSVVEVLPDERHPA